MIFLKGITWLKKGVNMLEKIKAVMLGHAVGDALGVPVEFCSREELDAQPVTDMIGWEIGRAHV